MRKLEDKYSDELVVIGVHSAKFDAERSTANIRQAVLRYRLEHPVVNDVAFEVWRRYAVRAWPTLMFIDPEGKVIGKHEGEIGFEAFDGVLQEMVRQFDERGIIDRRPVEFVTERESQSGGPLAFPGKVLADRGSDRLFISDTNHNRIVVASKDGLVHSIIGSGAPGLADGAFETSSFDGPQGLELVGDDTLYVADAGNHAIRRVDLADRRVKTVAGTGQQAMAFHRGGIGADVSLNSPWDLAAVGESLYIAMAGFHQLWRLDLATDEVSPFAGNGREGIVDGPLASAELAQPNGVAADGERLYFADSETSSIRYVDLRSGAVHTIVGEGLFTFGDVDGTGDSVRLQHVQGVDVWDGRVYVADSYNNKIKCVSPDDREVFTVAGAGPTGATDGDAHLAELHEPAGLSAADGRVYVADTNNHAIRIIDADTQRVSTLELRF